MENTQDFPKGLFTKKPNAQAPQFIKAKLSIKRDDFIAYLKGKEEEWLNFDVLESKDGTKYYLKQDTWKPNQTQPITPDIADENIPF